MVSSISFFLCLLLLLLLFPLFFKVLLLLLIVLGNKDKGVQGKDAPDHSADVYCKHHVIVFGCETANQVFTVEVGQEIHNFLEEEHDFVVGRQLLLSHIFQVFYYLLYLPLEALQGLHLLEYTAFE